MKRQMATSKKERSFSDRDSYCWQDLYVFPRPSSRVLDSTHAVLVKCIHLI